VARLLLIEDDPAIRTPLIRALRERGHAVATAYAAIAGLQTILDDRPDLVILDLGLPDLDGLELLRMVRAVSAVPVIIATARDHDADVVRGLDAGADDYVVKPFTAAQLDARVRAVLRRGPAHPGGAAVLAVGELRIDPGAREASLAGTRLELTPREFDLLHHLANRAGQVVSKRELLTEVWRVPYGSADKTVDVHLSWLRRKLGETAQEPRYLHTVRGVGIRLSAPPDAR
jgi:DNA-binding response OmpR family regulator